MILNKKNKIKKKTNITYTFIFLKYYFFLSISLFLIFVFLIMQTGYFKNYKKTILDRLYKSSYNNYLNLPYIIPQSIYGFFINIPEININISFKNQLILDQDRKDVIKKVDGMSHNFIEVPASIDFNDQRNKIDLRLKGDRDIHYLEKNKASYKITIDKNKTILGLNKFSLHKPRARNYIHEWLFHQLMQEGGIINLKYEFVKLKINGESKGLYVIEEGFDKILIERNKRRNGPIFKINEKWNSLQDDKSGKEILFDVYNKKNWLSEENLQLTLKANNIIKEFFSGKLDIENIFDVKKWAWYFAAADLNYYGHGTLIKSVKFYFNPLIAKFEPISFDGHRLVVDFNKNIKDWEKGYYRNSKSSFESAISCNENITNCPNPLPHKFFFDKNGKLNKDFFNEYKKNINKITSKKFLDNFFNERKKQILKINAKIYSDYFYADNTYHFGPGLYYFNKNEIYKRANRLRLRLSSDPSSIFITQTQNRIDIKKWNFVESGLLPYQGLILQKIYCKSYFSNEVITYEINKVIDNIDQFIFLEKKIKNKIKCNKALFVDKIYKTQFIKEIDHLNSIYKKKTNIDVGSYLNYFYVDGVSLRLKKKQTTIDKNIIIPKGYVVKITSNEEITLINNSFIISESTFNVDGGNPLNYPPIKIRGKKDNNGGGIFIKNTVNENYFQNVFFENLNGNLNNILFNEYIIYGSLNIYNSKIKLQNFQIKNIFSEDAINIVNSTALIENGFFQYISSDAIDVDNGDVYIKNLQIKDITNDAIDFSESNATVANVYFENIGDKAISAGENSNINSNNLKIVKSYLGIVSKDGSIIKVKDIMISNVTIPYAAYKKKNEYKTAELQVKNANYEDYKILYLKDRSSKVIIGNKIQKEVTNDILDKIYNPQYKIY